MLGSIIGDIIGSRFEFMSTQEKDIELFSRACSWTDDTVCTYAVAKATKQISRENISDPTVVKTVFFQHFKQAVELFPMAGYGKMFHQWVNSEQYTQGQSAGNGCLMRIAPVVMLSQSLEQAQALARLCTQTSHNHPDSLSSVATFVEILFFLKTQRLQGQMSLDVLQDGVRQICLSHGLHYKSLEEYHEEGGYWGLAKDTLPRAISGYLQASSMEMVFKNMLYIGSDTDTTASVAGSMAELTYPMTSEMLGQLYRYFNHREFVMLKEVCGIYPRDAAIHGHEIMEKIGEILSHQPQDPTAQWDPLELPSDEEYYKDPRTPWWRKLLIRLKS